MEQNNFFNENVGIYMWTSPSGKMYIGQSIKLKERKRNFLKFNLEYAGDKINKARKKYNKASDWRYEVLEYCTEDALDEKEMYWISFYNTIEEGYNSETGGNLNKHLSEETKKKLSESHKGKYDGENNPWFGKQHSKETKIKISESRKGKYVGENHHMYGKHHSEETRKKLSESHKGKCVGENHPMYGKHLSEETKIKISESRKGKCVGENHHMYGKHFSDEVRKKMSESHKGEKHHMYGKHLSEETKEKIGKKHSRPVLQYTKEGEFIKEWESVTSASKELGISHGHISSVCNCKRKSTGGYIWKYKDEPKK